MGTRISLSPFFYFEQWLRRGIVYRDDFANVPVGGVDHFKANDLVEIELVFIQFRQERQWEVEFSSDQVFGILLSVDVFKFHSKQGAFMK